jgi:phenylacetate-CoA ligase
MSIKNKFLELLPVFAQDIIISFYGYILIKQRYGNEYYQYRDSLLAQEPKSSADLLVEQNILLDDFVRFSYKNSKFYQSLYEKVDFDQAITLESLAELPIVTKEMLRTNLDDVYTIGCDQGISSFTGGTTGKSLQVVFTKEDFQKRMAYLDAYKIRLGIDPFESKKATFSGREFTRGWATSFTNKFWRNNWTYKQRLYSTFDMVEGNLPFYVQDLNRYKPEVINGFVSAIFQLAKFIEQKQLALDFQVKAIFTTSETLLPFHRELIEKVFKCPVYNQYASAEGAPFITECSAGSLHYNTDTGVIEVIETNAGTEMLVTSFTTHGTPLIRYKIGDLIKLKTGECRCGSLHPLVDAIEGRQVEFLISKQYGHVSLSHLADVIKGLPNCVINVQFQQYKVDLIDVLLNVDQTLYDQGAEDKIAKALIHRFGKDTQFIFKLVDHIPKESSGKFSLIKNFIK